MMGRSVEAVSYATATAYLTYAPVTECWECAGEIIAGDEEEVCALCEGTGEVPTSTEEEIWDDYVGGLRSRALRLFPSMSEENSWLGYPWRETQVIASNAHSCVSVAEYCGIVAVSLLPKYDRVGAYWRKRVAKKFLGEFTELTLVGTGSNGISLYTAKEGA